MNVFFQQPPLAKVRSFQRKIDLHYAVANVRRIYTWCGIRELANIDDENKMLHLREKMFTRAGLYDNKSKRDGLFSCGNYDWSGAIYEYRPVG